MFEGAREFILQFDPCQRTGNISWRNEMARRGILEVEIFNVWGFDYQCLFISSQSNKYIHVAVDYVSKWVEAIATSTDDAKAVTKLLKKVIFPRFGVSIALISDGGSHFNEKKLASLLTKYRVRHRTWLGYHPHRSSQVEVSNREIKKILEKVVNKTRKDWIMKLDNSL
ncbi:uncharacterized protein LOC141628767 [Silene latifolia]|uniref:uncharacterized protein LOC141628767 n=1 Tax=Silene latifolia TaxID=37657 RepID=UPI003D76B804